MSSSAMLETMKPPPTLPPGVTVENRAVKFSGWQGKTAYYSEGDRKIDLFKSDAKGSQDPTSKFEVFGCRKIRWPFCSVVQLSFAACPIQNDEKLKAILLLPVINY